MISSLKLLNVTNSLNASTRVVDVSNTLLILQVTLLILAFIIIASLIYLAISKKISKSTEHDYQFVDVPQKVPTTDTPPAPPVAETPIVEGKDESNGGNQNGSGENGSDKGNGDMPKVPVETSPPTTEPDTKLGPIDHPGLEEPTLKRIGYIPVKEFENSEPVYPMVIMPEVNSIIKPPQKGKTGRKGFTEERFKTYLTKHFRNDLIIGDDDCMFVKDRIRPYEPDFSLNDKKSRNILLDIEIDEPYQGINEIENRKPTHYIDVDDERNNAFTNRGWIVIRFAEIQVHQSPDACCRFVADVLKTIISEYRIPKSLKNIERPPIVKQWTKLDAILWSYQKYREKYLSIESFGYTEEKIPVQNVTETEQGKAIEEIVEGKKPIEIISISETNNIYDHISYQIKDALYKETYLFIDYNSSTKIVKPIKIGKNFLRAYCFVKNANIDLKISQIRSASLESHYYLERISRPTNDQIKEFFDLAQSIRKLVRVKYVSESTLIKSTGELVYTYNYHTISDMKPVEDGLRKTKEGEFNVRKGQHFDATNLAYNFTITLNYDKIHEIELLNT